MRSEVGPLAGSTAESPQSARVRRRWAIPAVPQKTGSRTKDQGPRTSQTSTQDCNVAFGFSRLFNLHLHLHHHSPLAPSLPRSRPWASTCKDPMPPCDGSSIYDAAASRADAAAPAPGGNTSQHQPWGWIWHLAILESWSPWLVHCPVSGQALHRKPTFQHFHKVIGPVTFLA